MLGNRTDVEEVRAQLARQPELFEQALAVAINHCLAGKAMEGRASLRVLVNATIGFEALAALVGKPAKSLHRMLGPRGNPTLGNFAAILAALAAETRVRIGARVERAD